MENSSFLTEDNGNPSWTRLSGTVCLIQSIAISYIGIFKEIPDAYLFSLTFLAAALCPKLIQKFVEQKINK